jgi:propanol-preferring alcohol dehydrogenase
MTSTYKAVEVSAPGALRVVERQVPEPVAGQVRIRVEACGNTSQKQHENYLSLLT